MRPAREQSESLQPAARPGSLSPHRSHIRVGVTARSAAANLKGATMPLAKMGVRGMHSIKLVAMAGLASLCASQAFAEDTMGTMTMMKGGQVTAIMPDGHMGTMMPDAKTSAEMMKTAKPIKHCMMMMTDAKGKTYMIDTSTKKAQAECEKMAM
ncbi:hypothetical protein [Mesorhizobium captivum]|uniref:hypothetical protein n=1 Tax=Mesorhizobium captivum TaxID=3072319 RepID=UPI002A23AA2F|nr:hypothetical protein [Mesorhizobium sp. VK3C]MDX8446301.1 hypothetical protein [Mesorhizobium sp. VK3C]